MTKVALLLILLGLSSIQTSGQSIDSLVVLIKSMQRGENDSIRFAANDQFRRGFEKILSGPGSFENNFDSLKNISTQTSEDKKLRLYTWVVPHYDGTAYSYYGFLHYKISENKDSLLSLNDSTAVIQKPESEKLSPARWLGSVYYGIVMSKKSKVTYYTLLGWKAKDKSITQKIIDVLYFDKEKPKFGYPLFKTGSVYKNRIIFSFNAQATMTLRYNDDINGIVFDHISVNKNDTSLPNGADGTYDAFKLKKGKWVLYKDVDVRVRKEN